MGSSAVKQAHIALRIWVGNVTPLTDQTEMKKQYDEVFQYYAGMKADPSVPAGDVATAEKLMLRSFNLLLFDPVKKKGAAQTLITSALQRLEDIDSDDPEMVPVESKEREEKVSLFVQTTLDRFFYIDTKPGAHYRRLEKFGVTQAEIASMVTGERTTILPRPVLAREA
jgi:hypothetical protein